jgi:cyanophycinase-like exopeptidase
VLMPIGGNEDKTNDKVVLSRFAELAGGDARATATIARAVHCPMASSRTSSAIGTHSR